MWGLLTLDLLMPCWHLLHKKQALCYSIVVLIHGSLKVNPCLCVPPLLGFPHFTQCSFSGLFFLGLRVDKELHIKMPDNFISFRFHLGWLDPMKVLHIRIHRHKRVWSELRALSMEECLLFSEEKNTAHILGKAWKVFLKN